jgi:hypothetical protein
MPKLMQFTLVGFILAISGCAATYEFVVDTMFNSLLGAEDGDDLPEPMTDRMSRRDAARANLEYDNAREAAEF